MKPTILQGHTRPIKSINISSDASKVYSASNDRTIISWNTEKKEKDKVFMHAAAINCFIISSCGKYLISGDNTATVYIWDIEKCVILTSIEGDPVECVKSIFLNNNENLLLITFAGRAKQAPSRLKSYDFKKLVFPDVQVNSSSNGTEDVNSNYNYNNYYENTNNTNNNNKIYNLIDSPVTNDYSNTKNDGLKSDDYSNQSIYNNSNNKSFKKKKKEKDVKEPVHQTVKLNMNNIPTIFEVKANKSKYVKAVYVENDKYILAAKEDGSVELISSTTGETLLSKQVHTDAILDMDFSEKLRFVLTASMDSYCTCLSLDTFEILYKFRPENPTRNINTCRLVLINNPFKEKKKVDVDDLFNDKVDESQLLQDKYLKLRNNDKLPLALFSGGQDSKLVTTTHKNEGGFEIFVCELLTGIELLSFESHFGPVNSIGCLLESPIVASGSEDATVRVYNVEDYIRNLDN